VPGWGAGSGPVYRRPPRDRPGRARGADPGGASMSDRSPHDPANVGALFTLDGDLIVPGPFTRGPWYDDALHGSAMLALMARAAEQHPTDVPRQVVRLTVDMMRAAPMAPL